MSNPRGTPQNLRPWQAGQSGNPAGRSVARMHLDQAFVTALLDDFRTHGAAAIERCRRKHVAAYLNIIARTLPKDVSVEVMEKDEASMAQVNAIVNRFREMQAQRDQSLEQLRRLEGGAVGQLVEG